MVESFWSNSQTVKMIKLKNTTVLSNARLAFERATAKIPGNQRKSFTVTPTITHHLLTQTRPVTRITYLR